VEISLVEACKKLHFGSGLAAKAKKIKAETHVDFLLQLFTSEIEERERKRRNNYMKAAKFDIIKTFENYTFEDRLNMLENSGKLCLLEFSAYSASSRQA